MHNHGYDCNFNILSVLFSVHSNPFDEPAHHVFMTQLCGKILKERYAVAVCDGRLRPAPVDIQREIVEKSGDACVLMLLQSHALRWIDDQPSNATELSKDNIFPHL